MTDRIALLLSRAGFGPTRAQLTAARKVGYAETLRRLMTPSGADHGAARAPLPELGLDPYSDLPNPTDDQRKRADAQRRDQTEVIQRWWLDRLTVADHQVIEKLLVFWHGHWATSVSKVSSPQLMLVQHRTLRSASNFAAMARVMVHDPALVYWLDGHLNTSQAPNENLGRELMELFMLGIGNYSETDVKEAGRALTGWQVSLGGERVKLRPDLHDKGMKTILGRTANFDADSLVEHLLTQPACPPFIAARLWRRYGSATEPLPGAVRDAMVAAFPDPIGMLTNLFEHDLFQASGGQMVKQPVEWLVTAMRQLGLRPAGFDRPMLLQLLYGLQSLQQLLFAPPSVAGWPQGAAWLTSAAAQVRLNMAGRLAEVAAVDGLTPESLADLLVVETWTNRTYAALRDVTDGRKLLTLGLASPEYLVS